MKHPKLNTTILFHEIEESARKQITDVLSYDCVEKLYVMPDVHAGYTLPIGCAAITSSGVVSPEFVGFDIGCSVSTHCLNLKSDIIDQDLYEDILTVIPVGFNEHAYPSIGMQPFRSAFDGDTKALEDIVNRKVSSQMATLGGGNHFIEFGVDDRDMVWVSVHTGSRKVGHAIADLYMKKGKFLEGELAEAYLKDSTYARLFAIHNHTHIHRIIRKVLGMGKCDSNEGYLCHHNTVEQLEDGRYIHRKGCSDASLDTSLVIPLNMRDGVVIAKGCGNTSFGNTCSHGAGRVMSRGKAKKTIDADVFKEQMEGIVCDVTGKLDEAPDAYKNGDEVIAIQENLGILEVKTILKPKLVVKG